jgi:hypothetical protein
MKTKKMNKKLALSKVTITNLDQTFLKAVRGGVATDIICDTQYDLSCRLNPCTSAPTFGSVCSPTVRNCTTNAYQSCVIVNCL